MAYITAEELRDEVAPAGEVVSQLSELLFTDLVVQVSEAIDAHCYRSFEVPTTETVRYFQPTYNRYDIEDLDDIANTTGLVVATDTAGDGTYSTTLTANTDYVLETNRLGMVTHIRSISAYPVSRSRPKTIKLTARYGWPSVPAPVKRAALLWGSRLWNRKSSPSGVVGFGEFGAVRLTKIDPDVSELLAPYRDRGSLLR